jgi:cysteinyl-tRNA synthetase
VKNIIRCVIGCLCLAGCGNLSEMLFAPPGVELENKDQDFRQEMRSFVQGLSRYAKQRNPAFAIIPQNGDALIADQVTGQINQAYARAIDGQGRENLFYGYESDNTATDPAITAAAIVNLDKEKSCGITILATDYCWTPGLVDLSYQQNQAKQYVSFAANKRELNEIPPYPLPVDSAHAGNVTTLSQAKNFLYLLNTENFGSRSEFLTALNETDYDLVIMDAFFADDQAFTSSEIAALKQKKHGGSRMIVAYMSIGEAEGYRFYWQESWDFIRPRWLDAENPEWEGNYKVKYWMPEWQEIMYGNDDSYLKKILDAGFDGVYLDIIDAYEYYEELFAE